MSTVKAILARKGQEVITATVADTVLSTASLMNERVIGGVVVTDGDEMVGIFTERDLMRRVVVKQLDPAETVLADVMTSPVVSCAPDTTLDACATLMTEKRIRHLPVTDDTGVCGLLTVGDILAERVREQQETIGHLNSYVHDMPGWTGQ